jgi:CheY-like chemotaxis protein
MPLARHGRTPSAGTRSSVLIVDDFEDALDLYAVYLTSEGFHVHAARTGADGIALARTLRPAVILLDVRMPGMSGIDAAQILRADRSFDKTPIVALTARAMQHEHAAILAAGFDEVISKPCLPPDLLHVVKRLTGTRRSANASS